MVHTVRSTTLDPAPPPRAYLAASGGIFRDCAVHDYDAVRWVTGQEVIEVYAAGTNQDADWSGELGDVHTASSVLTLEGGVLGPREPHGCHSVLRTVGKSRNICGWAPAGSPATVGSAQMRLGPDCLLSGCLGSVAVLAGGRRWPGGRTWPVSPEVSAGGGVPAR
jgi:hypothetical protein